MSPEESFQTAVIDFAKLHGWRVAHFRPARTASGWRTPVAADGKGFPDLVLLHSQSSRIVVAELKSEKGKLSNEQSDWLDDFEACNVPAYVWKPTDWVEIEQVLDQDDN